MRVKYFFLLFCSILLVCCDGPAVTFEHPQPIDAVDQLHFPKNVIGQYISLLDSSVITITDMAITRGFNIKFIMCKKELDTMKQCTLIKDTLFNKRTLEKICVININDSLYTPYHLQDTLFCISNKHILRKDKGYYFLNMQYHSGWEVQKLECAKAKLILCSISDLQEIEDLKEITENNSDSLIQFDPDKKQLRKFIKSKGFSKKEEFRRLRVN
jgi:hypothetical protein